MRQPVLSDEHQRSIQIRTTPVLSTDHLNLDSALLIPCASLLTVSRTINFLFKVLFIFPSRYLFAIGLSPVFSLRWNLPPNWSSIPKELDSAKAPRGATVARPTGLSPSLVPHSRGLGPRPPQGQRSQDYNSEAAGAPDFQVGLFPVHSPLLGESWLVSFPPLSDMLKFGG